MRYKLSKTSVTINITTKMENISNVKKPRRPLIRSGFVSTEHCVLIVFHLDAFDNVFGTVDCDGMVLMVDFNDDRLLGASSIDNFCDSAENKRMKLGVNWMCFCQQQKIIKRNELIKIMIASQQ